MDKTASHSSDTGANSVWTVPVLTLLIVGVAVAYYWFHRAEPYGSDSINYIWIAEGKIADVHKPFTARILHPAIAGYLCRQTGLSVEASFFVTNVVSLAVFVGAGLMLVTRHMRSLALVVAIMFTPMILNLFREIYMPDCMHAALAAVFFLALARVAWWWAVPLFFLLQVTRESTILLTGIVVVAAAYQRKWMLAGGAMLFTLIGMMVVGHYAKEGKPNIHNINGLVYLVGKVPFSFSANACGVRLWTNTHAKNDPAAFPHEPLVSMEVPAWAPTGNMRQIGIYSFEIGYPISLLRLLVSYLGIMPGIAFFVIYWRRWRLLHDDGLPLFVLVALVYGVAAFLLVPSLGTATTRYTAYAWPLAWIAAPEFLSRYFKTSNRLTGKLAWLQAVACWTPFLLKEVGLTPLAFDLIGIAVALPCNIVAIRMLRQHKVPVEGLAEARS